jgi:vancomycin resistance protein YoaR
MRRPAILTVALFLVLAPVAGAQTPTPPPRIAQGVSAAGVDLSGLTLDEAGGKLYSTFSGKVGAPLSTHVAGRKFLLTIADVKLAFDVGKSARRAYNAGVAPHSGPVDVALYITYDADALAAYAKKVADTVHKDPRDASVKIGLSKITKVASRDGRSLNQAALVKAMGAALLDPP